MIIRAYDENQNPVTVSLIGDRHIVVNGKEITSTRDLSFDKQRMADRACDDLYDCPIFDGERVITTFTPNFVTAYAWQLAERLVDVNGDFVSLDSAVSLMDDDIREDLHAEGITDPQEFVNRYCERHRQKYNENFTVV